MSNFTIECITCSCRRPPTEESWPNGNVVFKCRCCKSVIPIVCVRCLSKFCRAVQHEQLTTPNQVITSLIIVCESCGNEEGVVGNTRRIDG